MAGNTLYLVMLHVDHEGYVAPAHFYPTQEKAEAAAKRQNEKLAKDEGREYQVVEAYRG